MFKIFFPKINEWQVGERKIQLIMHLINKLLAFGILEIIIYFILIFLKFKLKMEFLNTSEYITLIGTIDTFFISVAGILAGIYTYGNAQEWKYNANLNQNRNIVSPSNTSNINITIPKKSSDEVFSPPKGEV
jgi:hypothetical protein